MKHYLGKVDYHENGKRENKAYFKWELKNGTFSMSGEVWQQNMRDIYMGGQCCDDILKMLDNPTKQEKRMVEIWKRWHLNDMNAGCEHQRKEWNINKKLTLTKYTWSNEFYSTRNKATEGKLSAKEYKEYQKISKKVDKVCFGFNTPKYESPEVKELLKIGAIKADKTEEKSAGWTSEKEHPEGVLSKKCPVCGYKYGSAWLKEEIPEDIIKEIESWN